MNKHFPWLVWGLAALFFFAEYFARVSPSVMVPELMKDFHVDAMLLGSLSAFFYYSYVGMQIPVGILVDRYGPRRLLTINSILCALGCLLFAQAASLYMGQVGRFLMGFGASFAFVGSLKLASVWFPASRFGLLAGLTQGIGMLGASVGEAPMSVAVAALGWRQTMQIITIIFIVLALCIYIIVRDKPSHFTTENEHLAKGQSLLAGLKIILKNPQSWLNAGYAGFLYAPTAAFAELWGVSYLIKAYNISTHMAAFAIGLIFIGLGIGGPLVGWWSDTIGRRKNVMLISAILSLISLIIIIYVQVPLIILFIVLFFYGISNAAVATSYAVAAEINYRSISGTSMAFANMASVIVGAIFQPVLGWFLDLHWDGLKANGIPVYSIQDYKLALIALPICLVLAVVFCFSIKETYCIAKQ